MSSVPKMDPQSPCKLPKDHLSQQAKPPQFTTSPPVEYYDENGIGMDAVYLPLPSTPEQVNNDDDKMKANLPLVLTVREEDEKVIVVVVSVDQAMIDIQTLIEEVKSLQKNLEDLDIELEVIIQALEGV